MFFTSSVRALRTAAHGEDGDLMSEHNRDRDRDDDVVFVLVFVVVVVCC